MPLEGIAEFRRGVDGVEDDGGELHAAIPGGLDAGFGLESLELGAGGECGLQPEVVTGVPVAKLVGRGDGGRFVADDPGEEGLQAEEIELRDRIELVIVALGTGQRDSEKRGGHVSRQIVERILPGQQDVRGVALIGPHEQVARGDLGGRILGEEFIPGDLLGEELVVGEVAVEGLNDPVAVFPREGTDRVGVVAGGFGEAHDIEPLAAPVFAIVGAGEQPVDQPFVRIGLGIGDEGRDLGGGGGEAGEIVLESADQLAATGGRSGGEPATFEVGLEKRVDGVEHPIAEAGPRNGRASDRLEGPMRVRGRDRCRGLGKQPVGRQTDEQPAGNCDQLSKGGHDREGLERRGGGIRR